MAGVMSFSGGAIGAAGALLKGQMTANSLEAQAGMQKTQAGEAIQAGEFNAYKSGIVSSAALGRSEAAYGASGVASSSTSVQAVLGAGAANAELDRQNIIHGATLTAVNYENQASLNEFGANAAREGSYFSALGSVLGGSANLLSSLSPGPGIGAAAGSEMGSADLTSEETAGLQTNIQALNNPESP